MSAADANLGVTERLVALVKRRPGMTTPALAAEIGVTRGQVSSALNRRWGREGGGVARVDGGWYPSGHPMIKAAMARHRPSASPLPAERGTTVAAMGVWKPPVVPRRAGSEDFRAVPSRVGDRRIGYGEKGPL